MSARRSEKTEAGFRLCFFMRQPTYAGNRQKGKKGPDLRGNTFVLPRKSGFLFAGAGFFPCGGAPLQKSVRKNHSLSAGVSLFLVRRKVSSVMRIISSANAARYQGRKENPIRLPSSPNRGGIKVEPT